MEMKGVFTYDTFALFVLDGRHQTQGHTEFCS